MRADLGTSLDNTPITAVTASTDGVAAAPLTVADPGDGLGLWWLSGHDEEGLAVHALVAMSISGSDWNTCDVTGPSITISSPTASTYPMHARIPVSVACTDPSGVASCDGSSGNGSLLRTDVPGRYSFTVSASDTSGNHSEQTVTYQVGERLDTAMVHLDGWGGPVVVPPARNVAKAGRTVPVKFRTVDDEGVPVTSADLITVQSRPMECDQGTVVGEATSAEDAGASGLRHLGDGWWQYAWKTERSWADSCRTFSVVLDGERHDLWFRFD